MNNKIIFILLACMLLSSCNTSRFGWKSEEKVPLDAESSRVVEDFDPLSLDDDDIVIEKTQPAVPGDEQEQLFPVNNEVKEDVVIGPKLVPGFRVNLMSGKDEIAILAEKKKAMMKFEFNIYVVFESPYYKIRLGDFLSEEDAAIARGKARRFGFSDAFIAKCLVDRERAELNSQL